METHCCFAVTLAVRGGVPAPLAGALPARESPSGEGKDGAAERERAAASRVQRPGWSWARVPLTGPRSRGPPPQRRTFRSRASAAHWTSSSQTSPACSVTWQAALETCASVSVEGRLEHEVLPECAYSRSEMRRGRGQSHVAPSPNRVWNAAQVVWSATSGLHSSMASRLVAEDTDEERVKKALYRNRW